jgi:hypothetical protein
MKPKFKLCQLPGILFFFFLSLSLNSFAQKDPAWLMESYRSEHYPSNVYITGFAQDNKNSNESLAETTERVKNFARSNLSESILSSIQSVNESYSKSVMEGDKEAISETFKSDIKVSSDLEINGIRIDTYVKGNIVYGFAYANKYEIIGFYKANLNMQVQQIEGFINTALELEEKREKAKAKKEIEKTLPIFEEVTKAQGILSAIDKNISEEDLKTQQTMRLYNELVQANARLAQGILVYMVSNEDVFGKKESSIENHLKAILAENNCSFTTNEAEADWKVFINANAREFNYSNNVYFSYVDAEVKLFKAPAEKHVFQNEFSQKGAHSKSYTAAANKASKDIGKPISEKILTWINN